LSLNDTKTRPGRPATSNPSHGRTAAPMVERRKHPRPVRNRAVREMIPFSRLGGMINAQLDREQTVQVMADAIAGRLPDLQQPLYMSSTNGQVLSMFAGSKDVRRLFELVDVVSADGQPLVTVSKLISANPLPERVATTDLFDDACKLLPAGTTFFMFGASPSEIERAAAVVRKRYPRIRLVGYCDGYINDEGKEALLARLETLKPDVLWIGLGAPREQEFVAQNLERLKCVKVIKTSGGLFNFISGTNKRAPTWMQKVGLEWLYRTILEPRRLAMRYLKTNPHSLYLLLRRSS
jgi:N-acetylglucosaminyldiphosphoundecaprenol N-acetyl-beta-D-mannosaminyltransferase